MAREHTELLHGLVLEAADGVENEIDHVVGRPLHGFEVLWTGQFTRLPALTGKKSPQGSVGRDPARLPDRSSSYR